MAKPLRAAVEDALVAYLTAQSVATNIYPGFSASDKSAPCVVAEATSGEEEPMQSGNYKVTVRVVVKGLAADGIDAFNTICDATRDALQVDGLHDSLNAVATDLTVFGVASSNTISWATEEDCWTETTEVQLYCCTQTFP